ncbi:MAG TPA: aminotransferase class V-fold PLP-dependent enzyme [Candidatus Sulfotelmatobacter sp.]|nr:aminotransferase class V-fold PLP-dependent enzyme [Candidatus Sulfotelmatobacter sp.]
MTLRAAPSGSGPPARLPCQRALFEIPDDIAYFNCAYLSPLMRTVRAAGERGVARKAAPWMLKSDDFFSETERARSLFAGLIGADADDIAIVPAASYGTAVAAANLGAKPGGSILALAEQFPSNVYPWRELAAERGATVSTVARPADGNWTGAILAAIDERTAIAALPHCHWTDGSLVDLVAVGRKLRAVGAALALDVTQSLGALPFDIKAVDPDFLVAATYKWLLGPYSLGFLYVAPRRQQGRPIEHNWIARAGSEDFAGLVNYRDGFQPGARRFDVGERSNFALMPMAIAALEQIDAWTVPAIAATLGGMTADIAVRAAGLGLKSTAAELRAPHFVGLRFPRGMPAGLPERLAAAKVHVSVRGDALRVTPHLYNNDADIDRLFAVLAAAL